MLIFLGTTAELFFIRAEEFIFTSKIIFSGAGISAKTPCLARNSVHSVQAVTFKLRLFIDIGKPKYVNYERYFNIRIAQNLTGLKAFCGTFALTNQDWSHQLEVTIYSLNSFILHQRRPPITQNYASYRVISIHANAWIKDITKTMTNTPPPAWYKDDQPLQPETAK